MNQRIGLIPLVVLPLLLVAGLSFLGFSIMKLQVSPPKTITVSGMAKQDQTNQVAQFTASVSSSGDSKEAINAEMQTAVDELTQAAIAFGISESNIKTEYFNIYQDEMTNYEGEAPVVRRGPWRGNTSVVFSSVPADQASAFADLLVNSGASNIYGPNFGVEDLSELESELTVQAVNDARAKAEEIAQSQGLSLGQILNISESGGDAGVYPLYRDGLGMGSMEASFNPGTQEISKTVGVTFELR